MTFLLDLYQVLSFLSVSMLFELNVFWIIWICLNSNGLSSFFFFFFWDCATAISSEMDNFVDVWIYGDSNALVFFFF